MVFSGNLTFQPDSYKPQFAVSNENGRHFFSVVGIATLTDTSQSSIPLLIPSNKPESLRNQYPPKPLVIPVGAQINRVDFRLPSTPMPGDEVAFGVNLPRGCTIVGVTGENIKVSPVDATAHTVTSPAIAAASNSYAPASSAVLSRGEGVGDAASPSLLRTVTGSPLTMAVHVSNPGNTAAGTGIRLSLTGARALVYARIIYSLPGDAIFGHALDLQSN